MNSHTSFCLNPNPAVSKGGSQKANEGFFWETQLWPFGNFDNTSGDATIIGGDVKGKGVVKEADVPTGDMKGKVVAEEADMVLGGVKEKQESRLKRKVEADVEMHIYTERERRKKMRDMFSNLHAMLPQLPPKTDKTGIVDEAVRRIKTLEGQLEKLQELKANRLRCSTKASIAYEPPAGARLKRAGLTTRESFLADHAGGQPRTGLVNAAPVMLHTWTSPNVVLNTFGQEAQIMICSPAKLGLMTSIAYVLDKNMVEVESASVSSDGKACFYMIHARLASGAIAQSSESFSADGVFKEAVREMIALFPSV